MARRFSVRQKGDTDFFGVFASRACHLMSTASAQKSKTTTTTKTTTTKTTTTAAAPSLPEPDRKSTTTTTAAAAAPPPTEPTQKSTTTTTTTTPGTATRELAVHHIPSTPSSIDDAPSVDPPGPDISRKITAAVTEILSTVQGLETALAAIEKRRAADLIEHRRRLQGETAKRLQHTSEYCMYIMAVDLLHFRQQTLVGQGLKSYRAQLQSSINRVYGDSYRLFTRCKTPSAETFPPYQAAKPQVQYSIDLLSPIVQHILKSTQMARRAPAAEPPDAPTFSMTTVIDRCVNHSEEYLQRYSAMLLQSCHDMLQMHLDSLRILQQQVQCMQQLQSEH